MARTVSILLRSDTWEQRMIDRFYGGMNMDPITNTLKEYEQYNSSRRDRYEIEDARFHRNMRAISTVLVILFISLSVYFV